MNNTKRLYRSLASEENRRSLVAEIKKVRQDVLGLVEIVPKERWYEPRYHGWSLAFILAHLNMMDDLNFQLMQSALRGFTLPIPKRALNAFNNLTSRVFRQREIQGTLDEIRRKEARILAFVLKLPPDQMHRKAYDPWIQSYLTVEDAVQEFFLIHWQGHLQTVRDAEDKGFFEPTAATTHQV